MTITPHRRKRAAALAALATGGLAVAACGSQSSAATTTAATSTTPAKTAVTSTTPTKAATKTTVALTAATASIDHYVAAAKHVFSIETSGPPTLHLFNQVVNDPHLLALLHSGNDAAAYRYATTQFNDVWAPEHMALLQFVSGGHTRLRLGVKWVVYPMPTRTVKRAGHPPVTIQVAEQDVIGFVRAMHNKHPAVQVVVRGKGQHALSLLGPAAGAKLPSSGFVTIRGVRYEVRSFKRQSYAKSVIPLSIWILLPTK